ncbi:MAG: hypothetical protein ACRCSN_05380, partial [Dermatophilaceae bacterium]
SEVSIDVSGDGGTHTVAVDNGNITVDGADRPSADSEQAVPDAEPNGEPAPAEPVPLPMPIGSGTAARV